MLKPFKNLLLVLVTFISFNLFAGIIPASVSEISDEHYVTYGGYDIMWVSATSYQFLWSGVEPTDITYSDYQNTVYQNTGSQSNIIYNQLLSTGFNGGGWQFFEELGLSGTANEFMISIYENEFGSYIDGVNYLTDIFYQGGLYKNAFEYWNATTEDRLLILDDLNFSTDVPFASEWENESGEDFFAEFRNTFYIRPSNVGSTPVPEPSTILTFSIALIALAGRRKLFK